MNALEGIKMVILGSPNIEKQYKKKGYRGLIKALDHKDPNIVSRAEEALRKLAGDKDAIDPLTNLLQDEKKSVRDAAKKAMEKIKRQG